MQKRILLSLLGVLLGMPVFAAQNTISMVTYFPIPYVSYENAYVNNEWDLGLGNKCLLSAGKTTENSVCPFKVSTGTLENLLQLKNVGNFTTVNATNLGWERESGGTRSQLSFGENLRIGSTIGSSTTSIVSLNATTLKLPSGSTNTLDLFPDYVSNAKSVISNCTSGAHWATLKGRDGQPHTYLVCDRVGAGSGGNNSFIGKTITIKEAYVKHYEVNNMVVQPCNSTYHTCFVPRSAVSGLGWMTYPELDNWYYAVDFATSSNAGSTSQGCNSCVVAGGTHWTNGDVVRTQPHTVYSLSPSYTYYGDQYNIPVCPSGTDNSICNANCDQRENKCAYKCVKGARSTTPGTAYYSYSCDCSESGKHGNMGICGTGVTLQNQSAGCYPQQSTWSGSYENKYYQWGITSKTLLTCEKSS